MLIWNKMRCHDHMLLLVTVIGYVSVDQLIGHTDVSTYIVGKSWLNQLTYRETFVSLVSFHRRLNISFSAHLNFAVSRLIQVSLAVVYSESLSL